MRVARVLGELLRGSNQSANQAERTTRRGASHCVSQFVSQRLEGANAGNLDSQLSCLSHPGLLRCFTEFHLILSKASPEPDSHSPQHSLLTLRGRSDTRPTILPSALHNVHPNTPPIHVRVQIKGRVRAVRSPERPRPELAVRCPRQQGQGHAQLLRQASVEGGNGGGNARPATLGSQRRAGSEHRDW